MFGPIMVHVAALTEGCEVLRGVVGRVVIAVPGCEDDTRRPHLSEDIVSPDRQANEAPCPIPPGAFGFVPPAAISEMEDSLPVGASADLTEATCTREPDHGRELGPIDGVEEAMLAPDGHGRKRPRFMP